MKSCAKILKSEKPSCVDPNNLPKVVGVISHMSACGRKYIHEEEAIAFFKGRVGILGGKNVLLLSVL